MGAFAPGLRRRGGNLSTTTTTTTTTAAAAAAAILAFGLLVSTLSGAAAQDTMATTQAERAPVTIQAVPDSMQLSPKGSQAGCDHYRHGYLGLAMCVNFYDEQADSDKPVVQVIGTLTNEGQVSRLIESKAIATPPELVDICNMTLAIEGLANATHRSPTWLPTYPAKQSFKAGTYVPFTVILPLDMHSVSYPSVDVLTGFYACDAALKPLPDDQVVPPPGAGQSGIDADNDVHPRGPSKTGLQSKIKWEPGFAASAGSNAVCLRDCIDPLYKHTDDCAAAHFVLHSGCIKSCPASVAQWTIDACTNARCKPDLCTLKTSGAPSQPAAGQSFLLLATAAIATLLSAGGLW